MNISFINLGLKLTPILAQAAGSLSEGASKAMGIVMLIGFIFGTIAVIGGGFQIRRGDADAGKLSIIGGLIIAGAPVIVRALFTRLRARQLHRGRRRVRMSDRDLRFTETNSADDSQGRTWGLEGNLFWYVAAGGFVSVVILLVLFSAMRVSLSGSLIVAAIPLALTLVYVFTLRQGKPPGYDVDLLDYWLNGCGCALNPHAQPQNPAKQADDS